MSDYASYRRGLPIQERFFRHLCRNTACVNPWHLEPVPNAVNIARGRVAESNRLRAARITHCPQRHEYTPENTRVYDGKRKCVTCSRSRALARHHQGADS